MICDGGEELGEQQYSCKNKNDPGNETYCDEDYQNCVTIIGSKKSHIFTNVSLFIGLNLFFTFYLAFTNQTYTETTYFKGCGGETYPVSGCLKINMTIKEDSFNERFNGSICYCDTDGCNKNFDANDNFNNSSNQISLSIIAMLLSFLSFTIFMK